jgi:hypothetical protein
MDSTGGCNTLDAIEAEGVLQMKQRPRIHYTERQKALMWERWQKGESLQQIAQLFKKSSCPATTVSSATAANEPETLDHWITSSARSSNEGGIVSPSAFAVFRLITNSNLVGCSIGRSPGLAPLRILSTYVAARRHCSALFGP